MTQITTMNKNPVFQCKTQQKISAAFFSFHIIMINRIGIKTHIFKRIFSRFMNNKLRISYQLGVIMIIM
jgi:hypothetical protein